MNLKYRMLSALFAASLIDSSLSACVTDGGYAVQGTACASDCFSFPLTSTVPYLGPNTPPTDPSEGGSTATFCTTVPFAQYDPSVAPGRKDWGFCKCTTTDSTASPTVFPTTKSPVTSSPTAAKEFEEVWLADGGGVGINHPESVDSDGYQACQVPFTFVAADGSQLSFDGCVSFSRLEPFLGAGNDFPFPPVNSATNTSLWCPVNSNIYDIDPPANIIKERKDWGYCLLTLRELPSSSSPTSQSTFSSSPTLSPTLSPTSKPSSSSSLSSSPTLLPTSFPFDDYYDDNETDPDDNGTASKPPTGAGSAGNRVSFGVVGVALTLLVAAAQVLRE